ncbi:MAG: methyltransferase domain-containing protein [Candidatus Korobacteraceae bacterium]
MLREGLLQYWWMLYRHSKVLNQRTDIFRNVEDAFTVKHADPCLTSTSVYLDIGSGSSVVPTFLYQRHQAQTYATETDKVYLDRQKSYMKTLGLGRRDAFFVQPEDATRLSFADGSVNFISAVSTIEHIPGNGDIESMAEFARVLPSKGRLVVTVPASPSYVENESTFYYAGFERRYDPAALQQRLGRPDLELIDQLHMVSPSPEFMQLFNDSFRESFHGEPWNEIWYKSGWHDQYPDVSILMTLGFVRLSTDPTGSFGACLAFEKK